MKNLLLWIVALVVGAVLGLLGLGWLNSLMDFVATVYTRLFQLLAVPTIALAVITTLTSSEGYRAHFRENTFLYPLHDCCGCSCRTAALCRSGSGKPVFACC